MGLRGCRFGWRFMLRTLSRQLSKDALGLLTREVELLELFLGTRSTAEYQSQRKQAAEDPETTCAKVAKHGLSTLTRISRRPRTNEREPSHTKLARAMRTIHAFVGVARGVVAVHWYCHCTSPGERNFSANVGVCACWIGRVVDS